jgi:glycosyltransferase involved in cell wall biosynthesis
MPTVTFLVPCYRLAHFLPECVDSILGQTHADLEVVILDDCSPDDTPAVAARFTDPRVRYVRHPQNLGHLRNYNAGIALARGEYVWLISADDRLRRPYIVERFVDLAERHPEVGFVFCPGVGLRDGRDTAVLGRARSDDPVRPGREFLHDELLGRNLVLAASGMVRRRLYDTLGGFPLDLPYAGDWYLWCLFSLHADVGYLPEPMVSYRDHDRSMTRILSADGTRRLLADEFAVRWRIARVAGEAGAPAIRARCEKALAEDYARFLAGSTRGALRGDEEGPVASEQVRFTPGEVEAPARANAWDAPTARAILVRSCILGGDIALARGERARAAALYAAALRARPASLEAISKSALLRLGRVGDALRRQIARVRRAV